MIINSRQISSFITYWSWWTKGHLDLVTLFRLQRDLPQVTPGGGRQEVIHYRSDLRYSTLSSAKSSVLQLTLRGRSFIYSRESSGPNILPWGTPEDSSIHSDEWPPIMTLCVWQIIMKPGKQMTSNAITATYKASDDEKPCRRLLQSLERSRRLSHLSQENCTMSVAAEAV